MRLQASGRIVVMTIIVIASQQYAWGDAEGWTPEIKAAAIRNCRNAAGKTYVTRVAQYENVSPDEVRRRFEVQPDSRALLGLFLATCDCTLNRIAAKMPRAEYLADEAGAMQMTRALATGECAPASGEHFRAAGSMQVRINANEDHSKFCSERYPHLASAIAEHLSIWRSEWEQVIRATAYLGKYATAMGAPPTPKSADRVLQSLREEEQALSCQNFLKDLRARKWREWRTDRRFRILEEFASRIPAR